MTYIIVANIRLGDRIKKDNTEYIVKGFSSCHAHYPKRLITGYDPISNKKHDFIYHYTSKLSIINEVIYS